MARPPLPVGMHGRIDFHHGASGRVRARTRIRGTDGVLRAVTRWGSSEAEASARLLVAVHEQACDAGVIAADTRPISATQVWLNVLERSDLAASTRQLYRAAACRYVIPALGSLLVGELTVPTIERALASIRSRHGPQPARAARRALSNLCHCAVQHGALRGQPGARHSPDRLSA